jgi:DNA-directed RNA polymerase sigma subunit (sigma70/sigma32)
MSSVSGSAWKEAQAAKALAIEAGLTDRQLREALKVKQRRTNGMLSFEAWMQQGRDFETDLTPTADETVSSIETEQLKQTLSRFLRPKEMEALSWRYGLIDEKSADKSAKTMPTRGKWGEAMSFVEVGKKLQVSAEYSRRLVHAALNKLRHAAEEGALEPALLF